MSALWVEVVTVVLAVVLPLRAVSVVWAWMTGAATL